MGIQAQFYAESVASEILELIKTSRDMGDDDEQILEKVEERAKEIQKSAQAGWY